jgi:hypothetical protein
MAIAKQTQSPKSWKFPVEKSAARPEIILVDEVSESIGQPDLRDYSLQFTFGSIQAWVHKEEAPSKPTSIAKNSASLNR